MSVEDFSLNSGEFYTIIGKNENGERVFVKDGIEPDYTYSFNVPKAYVIYFTISIDGKVFGFAELWLEIDYTSDDPSSYNP